MGFDWESILDADGADLGDAYDDAVADAVYSDDPGDEDAAPPIDEE